MLASGCPRCGSNQWNADDHRTRRLREFDGDHIVSQERWKCRHCKKVVTVFNNAVVPRFLYSRAVIISALSNRLAGATWEKAAALCTAEGQVDPSVLKRWQCRFVLIDGSLVENRPPGAPFSSLMFSEILQAPVGSWSPDLPQEDHWARSPPQQP